MAQPVGSGGVPRCPPRRHPLTAPGRRSRRLLVALAAAVASPPWSASQPRLGLPRAGGPSAPPRRGPRPRCRRRGRRHRLRSRRHGFAPATGTPTACHQKATSDLVLRLAPQAVLALGDLQYVHADLQKFATSYDPTWGRFKNITHPAIGNHEGGEGGSNKAYFDYFGAAAGAPDKGYYSYDLAGWHLIALNSNCGIYSFNGSNTGCAAGSAQETWLRATWPPIPRPAPSPTSTSRGSPAGRATTAPPARTAR